MTRNEIKAMFTAGSTWRTTRTPGFRDEATSTFTATVLTVRSEDFIFSRDGKKHYGDLPKMRDVIEARPGYLKFRLGGSAIVIERELVS
jgi:hypothetical protein